jgi:hypothetical protein
MIPSGSSRGIDPVMTINNKTLNSTIQNKWIDGIIGSDILTSQSSNWETVSCSLMIGCFTTGITSGTITAYHFVASEVTHGLSGVRVAQFVVFCVVFCRALILSFLSFFVCRLYCMSIDIAGYNYFPFGIFKLFLANYCSACLVMHIFICHFI